MRTIFIATSLLLFLMVSPSHAVLTTLDSLDFAHAYEANSDLPSIEDSGAGNTNWVFFDHSAVNSGFAVDTSTGTLSYSTMSTLLGGDWFYSSGSGSTWATEVGASTSYTIEFNAKVTGGAGDAPGFHLVTADADNNKIWMLVAPDHVATSNGSTDNSLGGYDNATAFHTYRMAFDSTVDEFTIWRDNVRIGENISATTTGAAYLGFGDLTSVGSGAAEIDYFRWDATGAYAPVDEVLPTYTPPASQVDSTSFAYKYEMDANPTVVDYDGNGAADWDSWANASATVSFADGKMIMPDGSALTSGLDSTTGIWTTQGFTAEEGFTVEFSLEVLSQMISRDQDATASAFCITFALSDSTELCPIFVGEDAVAWWANSNFALTDVDNADGQHAYRVSRDSDVDGGRWWLWRDGELLTPEGTLAQFNYTRNATYFGPGTSSSSSGSVAIDYLRMDESASSPVPEPSTVVLLLAGLLSIGWLRCKR